MLDASFNEVETLVLKAARGAGLPWGLAEETGRAARWLASFGLPWTGSLLRLLADDSRSTIRNESVAAGAVFAADDGGSLSSLLAGPCLVDRAHDLRAGPVRFRKAVEPLWVLPFAAQASLALGGTVEVRFGLVAATVSRHACAGGGPLDGATHGPIDVACTARRGGLPLAHEHPRLGRAAVEPRDWDALEALAARTYVPASELSRALGAGSGATDGD